MTRSNVRLPADAGALAANKKRKRAGDASDAPDDGQHADAPGGQSASSTTDERFACPLFKHSPRKYPNCGRLKGSKDIHRIKEHIHRVHCSPIFCPRCHLQFETEAERNAHLAVPDHQVCKWTDEAPPDGIDAATLKSLRSRKKIKSDGPTTDKDRWYHIYQTLYPGADLPSTPFVNFPGTPDVSRLGSPDSGLAARLDEFVLQPPARVRQLFALHVRRQFKVDDFNRDSMAAWG